MVTALFLVVAVLAFAAAGLVTVPVSTTWTVTSTEVTTESDGVQWALAGTLTGTSTGLAPASTALGLTDGAFTAVAVLVIGILALSTAYIKLKPRTTHH